MSSAAAAGRNEVGPKPQGVVVPMVTPLTASGSIDGAGVARVVDHLVTGGVDGVFVLGTTGERASVPAALDGDLVGAAVRAAAGRVPVYTGISANCLDDAVDAACRHADLGADFAVAHPPCYFPVPDSAFEAYFGRLADAIPLPLLLYNIPMTTHVSLALDTVEALSRHENIVGLKDSENDETRLVEVLGRFGDKADFAILMGAPALSVRGFRLGADGVVPTSANLAPAMFRDLQAAARSGDWATAERLQQETDAISAQYRSGRLLGEAIPALKRMMADIGLCEPFVLPPLQSQA